MALSGLAYRVVAASCALAVAWIISFVWLVAHAYDGFISLIFQPIMALVWSVLTVGLSLLLGLVLKLPPIRKRWSCSFAGAVGATGLAVLVVCGILGPTVSHADAETGELVQMLDPRVALPSYLAPVFAIANWPRPAAWDGLFSRIFRASDVM